MANAKKRQERNRGAGGAAGVFGGHPNLDPAGVSMGPDSSDSEREEDENLSLQDLASLG